MNTRKAFIERHGGTCRNWRWSWSFVDHSRKRVIFGAWQSAEVSEGQVILRDDWQFLNGRRQPGYSEAREYIGLVARQGYELLTFPMVPMDPATGLADIRSKIATFSAKLTKKTLRREGQNWLAIDT